MGDRIVYSTLCALENSTSSELDELTEMAALWAKHLRGPGRFDGRLMLLTNLTVLRVAEVTSIVVPLRVQQRRDLFLERVRQFRSLPVGAHDLVMQMDLDVLAVRAIDPLFAAIRPGELVAAQSGFSPLIHDNAGSLLTRRERWSYRLRGWYHRAGVSACVTACEGRTWPHVMRRWAAAMRARGRGRVVPRLGDQSFLNFLFVTGAARVGRLPRRLVHHVRQPGAPLNRPIAAGAVVLHFPLPGKLAEMHRAASMLATEGFKTSQPAR